jgi:hypothetical protein
LLFHRLQRLYFSSFFLSYSDAKATQRGKVLLIKIFANSIIISLVLVLGIPS